MPFVSGAEKQDRELASGHFLRPLVLANNSCFSAALGWGQAHSGKMMTYPSFQGTATILAGALEGTERQDRVGIGAQIPEPDS